MKRELRELMESLACPTCNQRLKLVVEQENEQEIITGFMFCSKCIMQYPIAEYNSLVGWVPAPLEAVEKMLELAQVGQEDAVYDLGCGDARVLIMAVRRFNARKAVGYEIRQDLIEGSQKEIRNQMLEDQVTVIRDNLLNADLSEASVVTLYLSEGVNEILKPKLETETRPATRIVSLEYPIETWRPARIEICSIGTCYLYRIPQAFQNSSCD